MAHFAKLNEHNMVTEVIVVDNANAQTEQEGKDYIASIGLDGTWIQTSYNNNFRKKFAGVGNFYDADKDEFIHLYEKSKWLAPAGFNYQKEDKKTILVDGFPRSGNVYLSYLLKFGFGEVEQYTGYKGIHDKDSIIDAPSRITAVVVPLRNPVDSIKSAVMHFSIDATDNKSLFLMALDNLEWMKLIKANKDKVTIVDFNALVSNPQAIINQVAKKVGLLPNSINNDDIVARMIEDNMIYNLPNDTTSDAQVDLSNPLIAEVIAEATEIYNELIG